MSKKTGKKKKDWGIAAILLTIWVIALWLVAGRNSQIPLSMYAIATLFFVILIPAMSDLVRTMEKHAYGQNVDPDEDDDEDR